VIDLPKDTEDDGFDDQEFGNRFKWSEIVFEGVVE
jgi:hypothetical protein